MSALRSVSRALRASTTQGALWSDTLRIARTLRRAAPALIADPLGSLRAIARAHPEAAIRTLEALPPQSHVKRDLELAELYRSQQDDAAALRVVTLAQRHHTGDRQLLMRLADLLRDDGQPDRAHVFLKLAEQVHPEFGAVRLLAFETDMGWLEDGSSSLEKILRFDLATMKKYLGSVNRVAALYPAHRSRLEHIRDQVRRDLRNSVPRSAKDLDETLTRMIHNRWLEDLPRDLDMGAKRRPRPRKATARRIQNVRSGLGPMLDLVSIGWENEHADRLTIVTKLGRKHLLASEIDPTTAVELFIPTPFFAYDKTEKPTYETVRTVFRHVASDLLSRSDIAIVPRLQFNWRHALPKTNARVISYHTSSEREPRRLHIQEAPLAGHCSLDSRGFAGFASIADDFNEIDRATRDLPPSVLKANFEELVQRYVKENVSKYAQSTSATTSLEGRYVFVAMQIQTDAVAELAMVNGTSMLRAVADAYAGTNVRVVVKRHPYCHSATVQRTLEDLSALGRIVLTSDSIHVLLPRAEAVFTVNSGVGLESLLHLRPAVITGKADYAYAATTAHSTDELRAIISRGPSIDPQRAQRFLHFYRHRWIVPADAPERISARLTHWLSTR